MNLAPNKAGELRFAVIGFGFMGRTHAEAFLAIPSCRLVSVVDRKAVLSGDDVGSEGNIDTGASGLVIDRSKIGMFDSVASMLEGPEIDLAIVTTPTPSHVGIAMELIHAGCNVLIEKPVSLDPNAIQSLDRAARKRNLIVMPAHCMRFWPAWAWMRGRILDGSFGRVKRARFRRTGAAPSWNPEFYLDPQKSGGAIVDLHIHDTDFVIHCFGVPAAVKSSGDRSSVKTNYEFAGGPEVEAVGAWLEDPKAPFTMQADIEFERGDLSFDLARDPEIEIRHADGVITTHPEASLGGTGYQLQAQALADAIRSGESASPVDLDDAVRTGRVLEAELYSLESGTSVQVRIE